MKHLFKNWKGTIEVDDKKVSGFEEIEYVDGDKIHIRLVPKSKRRKINYGGLKK